MNLCHSKVIQRVDLYLDDLLNVSNLLSQDIAYVCIDEVDNDLQFSNLFCEQDASFKGVADADGNLDLFNVLSEEVDVDVYDDLDLLNLFSDDVINLNMMLLMLMITWTCQIYVLKGWYHLIRICVSKMSIMLIMMHLIVLCS